MGSHEPDDSWQQVIDLDTEGVFESAVSEADRAISDAHTALHAVIAGNIAAARAVVADASLAVRRPVISAIALATQVVREAQQQIESTMLGRVAAAVESAASAGVDPTAAFNALVAGEATVSLESSGTHECPLPFDLAGLSDRSEIIAAYNDCGCCGESALTDECLLLREAWQSSGHGTAADLNAAACVAVEPQPEPEPLPEQPPQPPPDDTPAPLPLPEPLPEEPLVIDVAASFSLANGFDGTCLRRSITAGGWVGDASGNPAQQGTLPRGRRWLQEAHAMWNDPQAVYARISKDATYVSWGRRLSESQPFLRGVTGARAGEPLLGFDTTEVFGEFDTFGEAIWHNRQLCDAVQEGGDPDVADLDFSVFSGWGDPGMCETLKGGVTAGSNFPKQILSWVLGLRNLDGDATQPGGLLDLKIAGYPVGGFITNVLRAYSDSASIIANALLGKDPCFGGDYQSLALLRAVTGLLGILFRDSLEPFNRNVDYTLNTLCQTELIGWEQASAAWLANEITTDEWLCIVKAQGVHPHWAEQVLVASRTKLPPLNQSVLLRRGKIDVGEYEKRIRELGFIRSSDAGDIHELTRQIPPPSDIVRMMVRDSADDQLVIDRGLDDLFPLKFTGQLETWAKQQGIDPLYMKFLWRAHWRIPSNTQLYDYLHRSFELSMNDKAFVDVKDVESALQQNDMLPFWVPKAINAATRLLTRREAQNAFFSGVIDEADLNRNFRRRGFSEEDASALVKFNTLEVKRRWRNHKWPKEYAKGAINSADAIAYMMDEGATRPLAEDAVDAAKRDIDANTREACVQAAKSKLLKGEATPDGTNASLLGFGLDADQADLLVAGWTCEREAREKIPTLAQLCEWKHNDQISDSDYLSHLLNLGWDTTEADDISQACNIKLERKLFRSEESQARKVAAASKASEAAAQKRISANKKLMRAVEFYVAKGGGTVEEAGVRLTTLRNRLINEFGLRHNTSAEAVLLAVRSWDPEGEVTLDTLAIEFAGGLVPES